LGKLANADAVGRAEQGGPERFMLVYLRVSGAVIEHAAFQSYACGAAHACGSMLTELVAGRPVSQCAGLSAQDLASALEGIPPDKRSTADLAIAALQAALSELNSRTCPPHG
jgi:NifU-like protein involved in Fe-S cluster formation